MAKYQKGQGGRPKGVPNKATREIKEFATALISSRDYVESLKRRIERGTAPHMETLLFHYAHGKPKETTQIDGEVHLRVTWES